MSKLTGYFNRTNTGEKIYEIYEASPDILPKIAALLQARFGFVQKTFLDGIDVFYLDCVKDDIQITIGWDCWSGCFIMPVGKSPENDQIIEEIGSFLPSQLQSLK